MTSARAGAPVPEPVAVTFFPKGDDGETLPLAAWLELVANEEPADLPRPAADYLAEARATGEV
jgi:hypothetical protein